MNRPIYPLMQGLVSDVMMRTVGDLSGVEKSPRLQALIDHCTECPECSYGDLVHDSVSFGIGCKEGEQLAKAMGAPL